MKSTKTHHIFHLTTGDDTFDSSIVLARPGGTRTIKSAPAETGCQAAVCVSLDVLCPSRPLAIPFKTEWEGSLSLYLWVLGSYRAPRELNVECYDGWGQGARRLSCRACLERGRGRD